MTPANYQLWQHMLELIAQYDWAVEGAPAPAGTTITRGQARTLRDALVKLTKQVDCNGKHNGVQEIFECIGCAELLETDGVKVA